MIGRTLSHYRITGPLGAGGMGVVYAATDARLGREVALKFVSTEFAHDEEAVTRLRSEAKAASALNHPNICTIYDIGDDNGSPFIVMELMKGTSLRERLAQGALKVSHVVDIGIEIADALQVAHSGGIIHRDIKPANIFITEHGHVKVLDFGLAKLTTKTANTAVTQPLHNSATGVIRGTVSYMSPEQATGEPLDGRTDLFSLGVVLYECTTGVHPFPGDSAVVVLASILDRTPPSPLLHNPSLPPRLAEIIGNCLEKDRELRYQSAADLRADLKRLKRDLDAGGTHVMTHPPTGTAWGRTSSVAAMPTTLGSAPHTVVAPDSVATGPGPARPPSRATPLVMTAAALGVVVLGAAGALVWMNSSTSDAPPSPPPAEQARPDTARLLESAMASLKAGNYRSAMAQAREVLALDADHAEAARIRDDASAYLTQFDNEITDARRRLANRDVTGAAQALERARAIDPVSPAIPELSAAISEAYRQRSSQRVEEPPRAEAKKGPPSAIPPSRAATTPVQTPTIPAPPPTVEAPVPSPAAPAPAAESATRPKPPEPTPSEPPSKKEPGATPPERAAPPAPSAAEVDDRNIRQVIATYGRAIERKDIGLFRSIKPNLTADEERRLQDGFRAVTSQRVNLTILSIEREGDAASAVIRRRDEIVVGGRNQQTDAQQVLRLARTASGWVITEIR